MLLEWLRKLIRGSKAELVAIPTGGQSYEPTEAELLEQFRSYIAREIAAGYASPEDALRYAVEVMSDDVDPQILEAHGPKYLAEEWASHVESQAEWPETTDNDRLESAFAALDRKGIVSRQNFTCCGSCGSAEIWDEMEQARNTGSLVRGYTFFHQQDTESAVEGDGLYLNYGSVDEGDEAAVSIGREIQTELEAHGLATEWDGQLARRIAVSLDWKRRTTPPAHEALN